LADGFFRLNHVHGLHFIFSFIRKNLYCYTSDIANRFISHNELAAKGYTTKYRPWVIAYTEEYQTKTEAIKRENQLKSANGKKFIRALIKETFGNTTKELAEFIFTLYYIHISRLIIIFAF